MDSKIDPRSQVSMGSTMAQDSCGQTTPERGIGFATQTLWNGRRVFRRGWNGKGMYLQLQYPDANSKMSLPYVYMRTADNNLVPWICSQSDLLANDWEIFK